MTTEMPQPPALATVSPAARELKAMCGDIVTVPGDADYDTLRTPWNVAAQQHPAAVAVPTSAEEVALVVRAAAAAGLRVAPQGTGHGACSLSRRDLAAVVLLRTTALTGVSVDPVTGIARVGAGTLAEDLVVAAGEHGLACLHGSSPDVGVAGLTLGGGIGWYGRAHGLACNRMTAVELVTADGELVRADAENDADLFWAVRGGSGNFGVVTALEVALLPIADAYAGMMAWDIAHFEKVLRHYNAWAPGAPDEVSSSLRAMRFPPLPFIPEEVRGRSLVMFDGAVLADDPRAEEILAGFRALEPEVDTFHRVEAPSLIRLHGDPEGPTPAAGSGTLVDQLDEQTLQAYVAAVGPEADTHLLMAELRQLGGALRRPAEHGGALRALEADFAAYFVGIAPTPELAGMVDADAVRALESLAGAAPGRNYLNLVEHVVDPATGFDADSWARLQQLRADVDPTGLFLANHSFGG
jgi:FAD/FMN-containing dehydrogenase